MKEIKSFVAALKQQLKCAVLDDEGTLAMYATDASIYQLKPHVVVIPENESDVMQAVAIANEHKVSILPRGGGTSLAGQAIGRAMILDFSKHINKVIEINKQEHWVRVQPGLIRDELNKELARYRLHFAPDPATTSRANVGGMVGNNSSGMKSILYGKTVDHVLEARVVLADGTELTLHDQTQEEYQREANAGGRKGEIYSGFKSIHTNPWSSTAAAASSPTIMVDSFSSIMAGPGKVAPAKSLKRSKTLKGIYSF